MNNHTPGPWTACDNNGYSIWRVTSPEYRAESASRTVAEVVGDSAETEANARLITAAPEMYESLRDAILFMQFLGKKERALSAEEQEWLNKAVSLLDKIEGGGE